MVYFNQHVISSSKCKLKYSAKCMNMHIIIHMKDDENISQGLVDLCAISLTGSEWTLKAIIVSSLQFYTKFFCPSALRFFPYERCCFGDRKCTSSILSKGYHIWRVLLLYSSKPTLLKISVLAVNLNQMNVGLHHFFLLVIEVFKLLMGGVRLQLCMAKLSASLACVSTSEPFSSLTG